MPDNLDVPIEPTGERFIPEAMGGELIDAEHQLRYRFALGHVRGKRVLDAGCGVGWGTKLLLEAGASEVLGIDISQEAIDDCRRRVPTGEFRIGDLQELPVEDDRYDVVVCFEALEHTADTSKTLDELCRVLAPDGLLFVSSPNPRVYPSGNPFHLHEMPPEELQAAVAKRLPNVRMFLQHLHLSSLLYPEDAQASDGDPGVTAFDVHTVAVAPIAAGRDPYSVAVGSNQQLPELAVAQTLAPSDQLKDLGALAAALSEEREAIHADHERIVAERASILTRIDELATDLAQQRAATAVVAGERDGFGIRVVQLEQEAARSSQQEAAASQQAELRERLDAANEREEALRSEILAIRNTLSWRITKPLRSTRSTRFGQRFGR